MRMTETGFVENRSVSVPAELASPVAKLVYLHLAATGSATLDRLAADLDLQKLTLYAVLDTLESRRFVTVDEEEYDLCDRPKRDS